MAEEQAPALAGEERCKTPQDLEESGVKKTDVIEDDLNQCQAEKAEMPVSTTTEENAQNVSSPTMDKEPVEAGTEAAETEISKEENEGKTSDALKNENEVTEGQESETKEGTSEKNQKLLLNQEKATDSESPKEETMAAQPAEDEIHSESKEDKPQPSAKEVAGAAKSGAQAGSTVKGNTTKASKDANREKEKSDRSADLPRSRTMPKSYGRSSKKDIAEKFGGVATSGVRVQRSTSTGANAVKNMLLEWCRAKTRGREGVDIQNFSSSWSDGLAFCALILAFFPDAFDYDTLDAKSRRQNFQLAFSTAEKMADCPPLLDVEDMVRMKVPDSKCVYTYVQELYRSLVAKGLVKTKKA